MGNYEDFYEKTFGNINIGDSVKIYKEGVTYEGTLLFKNEYYITVQLPYYREGFSMPDFYTGHSKLAGVGGVGFEIDLGGEVSNEDGYEEDEETEEEFDGELSEETEE